MSRQQLWGNQSLAQKQASCSSLKPSGTEACCFCSVLTRSWVWVGFFFFKGGGTRPRTLDIFLQNCKGAVKAGLRSACGVFCRKEGALSGCLCLLITVASEKLKAGICFCSLKRTITGVFAVTWWSSIDSAALLRAAHLTCAGR